MLARLRPWFPTLIVLADVQAIAALAVPDAFPYLRAFLYIAYCAGTWLLLRRWGAVHHFRFRRFETMRIAHGLEHATLRVLEGDEDRYGGYSRLFDFIVYLPAGFDEPVARVKAAAEEAIARVAAGETELVYSPSCGTGTDVAGFAFALSIVLPGLVTEAFRSSAPLAFATLVLAHHLWAASERFLRIFVQRWFTVSADLGRARIRDVRAMEPIPGWVRVAVDLHIAPRA